LAVRKSQYVIINEICKHKQIAHLMGMQDRSGNTALHFAVAKDRKNGPRLLQFMLQHAGAPHVDVANHRQLTPLAVHIMTTRQTDPTITETLVAAGASAVLTLLDGSTLLHVAVDRDLLDIACALISEGAQLNATDRDGVRVIELAQRDNVRLKKLIQAIAFPPLYINEKDKQNCMVCLKAFKFGHRRQHCRHCGRVCCSECSAFQVQLCRFPIHFPGRVNVGGKAVEDPQRVCRTCYGVFKVRSVKAEAKGGFLARALGYEWDEMKPTVNFIVNHPTTKATAQPHAPSRGMKDVQSRAA
jgi:hypothetical protein